VFVGVSDNTLERPPHSLVRGRVGVRAPVMFSFLLFLQLKCQSVCLLRVLAVVVWSRIALQGRAVFA
jgi:hypothetical protein